MAVLSAKEARTWVRNGHLRREYRGVYSLGRVPQTEPGRILAAVRALEPDADASFRAAGFVLGMLRAAPGPVDVTTPRRHRPQPGLIVHSRQLEPGERTVRLGIPVTSPERTLLDLATVLPPDRLRRATRQAEVDRITTHARLVAFVERRTGTSGVRALRAVLDPGPSPTRSELEDRLLELIRTDPALPRHATNARVEGFEVDVLFPDHRLILEADGARYHGTPTARSDDAERQAILEAAGYRILRISRKDVTEHPARTLERIRAAL